MVGSEVYSSEVKKTEVLMENFRRAIGMIDSKYYYFLYLFIIFIYLFIFKKKKDFVFKKLKKFMKVRLQN